MRVLLVYPLFPDTFWSFKYALSFISKKTAYPPLGLLTVAAMLPQTWDKKLVDLNVQALKDSDIAWADIVMLSAMSVQRESFGKVIARCKKAGVKTVAGGPLVTAWPEKYEDVDYLVLNEAEITLPLFLNDIERGEAKHMYTSAEFPDISQSSIPLWSLIDMKKYSSMNIQYSRGCPYDCDFCDIVVLFGRQPRLKSTVRVVEELQSLYDAGWRDDVFFVDDNFIGNKQKLKEDMLPALIAWRQQMGQPFSFYTEASLNLADDPKLMDMMKEAGFNMVFVGIESPHEESLSECNKYVNRNRDLLESVDTIQQHGLQVQGGFILGFDSDPDLIFDMLIEFIQKSSIVVAMVGLLNAPRGTKLFKRLDEQNRIISDISGDNTDYSINFKPKMDIGKLTEGYKKVIDTIYAPKHYYQRVREYLSKYNLLRGYKSNSINLKDVLALIKSMFKLGILGKERKYYWNLLFHTLFHHPSQFPAAVTFAIYGYHFRRVFKI